MADPWPWGKHQHKPRIAQRAHRPSFVGREMRQKARPTGHAAAVLRDFDAVRDQQVRTFMDLMLL
jgi:hypothetical protein